ncbi:MAG: hypothetical protein ACI8X5_002239 [Planctomycetota bacterium]|jgi:hypothetical protein
MGTTESILSTFEPLLAAAEGLDLNDPAAAMSELEKRFPWDGEEARALKTELAHLRESGRICDRGELPMCWGRVTKALPESREFSIDVVLMNGAGPQHKHPEGEVNFCVATEGEPTFDGHAPGWVVFPPNSVHVPTVAGGMMMIVYLLPNGAMEFVK